MKGKILSVDEINRVVAYKLKLRRKELKILISTMANDLELSDDSVRRYEYGYSSIPVARLYQISVYLKVPIGYFFEDIKSYDYAKEEVYE